VKQGGELGVATCSCVLGTLREKAAKLIVFDQFGQAQLLRHRRYREAS